MRKGFAIVAAFGLTLSASAAFANVIDPGTDKANAKLRADIASQVSKYTFCLIKAAQKCEKKGLSSAGECNLATGAVSYDPGGDAETKFQDSIAKCDSKVNLTKKGTNYVGIGCPGDCNAIAPGTQQCTDIPAFQNTITAATATSAKGQLGLLVTLIDGACATDNPGKLPTDVERIDCVADASKNLSKYASGVFKCQAKCENDFKDKKGNGGGTNGPNCLAGNAGADANFNACVNKGLTKVQPNLTPAVSGLIPIINAVINDATNQLYNRFDPTSPDPAASPCGTCGNGTREGAEECDGADNAVCGGPACNADCTCP
jgi:hypothetical protein